MKRLNIIIVAEGAIDHNNKHITTDYIKNVSTKLKYGKFQLRLPPVWPLPLYCCPGVALTLLLSFWNALSGARCSLVRRLPPSSSTAVTSKQIPSLNFTDKCHVFSTDSHSCIKYIFHGYVVTHCTVLPVKFSTSSFGFCAMFKTS